MPSLIFEAKKSPRKDSPSSQSVFVLVSVRKTRDVTVNYLYNCDDEGSSLVAVPMSLQFDCNH